MAENRVTENKTAGNTVAESKVTDNKITGNAVAKRKKGRYLYMDILNIMACFCVVFIHHSNTLVARYSDTPLWREGLVIECGMYWVVPAFVMISGANLLNYRKKYTTAEFLKKRFLRTVVPFLIWSVVYLVWKVQTEQMVLDSHDPVDIFNIIINYREQAIFWYFIPLFGCYLAMPIFSLAADNRRLLWYATGVNFFFVSVVPVLKTLFGLNISMAVPISGGLMIFVLLGYLLATADLKVWQRLICYVLGIAGVSFRYIYTLKKSAEIGKYDTSIKGCSMFYNVFFAVGIFVLIKSIPWDRFIKGTGVKIISAISGCSFGVYLIHKILMYYAEKNLDIDIMSGTWRYGMPFAIYFSAVLIVFIVRKIPVIRRVFG